MIKILYRKIRMAQDPEDREGAVACKPSDGEIEMFLKETEEWVNANNMRIASVTPITGGYVRSVLNKGGGAWGAGMRGTATTCGLVIVTETK